jgi:hypothetical protein
MPPATVLAMVIVSAATVSVTPVPAIRISDSASAVRSAVPLPVKMPADRSGDRNVDGRHASSRSR